MVSSIQPYTVKGLIKVTINCAEGCWHTKFIALFQDRNWYSSQTSWSPQTHERNLLLSDQKVSVLNSLNAFEPATSRTAVTLFAPNYSATVNTSILNSCTTTRYLLGQHLDHGLYCICFLSPARMHFLVPHPELLLINITWDNHNSTWCAY